MRNKPSRPDQRGSDARRHRPREEREDAVQKSKPMIYGMLPVMEALRSGGRRIDKVLVAEGTREHRIGDLVDLARKSNIVVSFSPKSALDKYAGPGANHQGVIAFTAAADYAAVEDILDSAGDDALIVILDGVEDPQNLGAVLRSSECAGSDGVIIPDRRAVGLTETVAKASAGAIEYVKVAKVQNLNRLIEELKERSIWVVGTAGDAKMNYTEWDWTRPSAVVMGGEGRGLHRLVAENCDILVKIPMYGKIESLNVSAAASVILFEARRQRSKD